MCPRLSPLALLISEMSLVPLVSRATSILDIVSMVEDRTQRKRWIIYQKDLRVKRIVNFVLWVILSPILIPCLVLYAIGEGGLWFLERIQDYVISWLATWIMAILLNKRKEYPQVFKMDVQGGE